MVRAVQRAVLAAARDDVVHLEARDALLLAPGAHRREVCRVGAVRGACRALRAARAAALAAIAVAELGGAARDRPPVVGPELLAAAVAAPRAAPRRQLRGAPRARAVGGPRRERADRKQRVALHVREGRAHTSSLVPSGSVKKMAGYDSSCSRSTSRAPSCATENCIPVQNRPNSAKRADASSKRIA